MTDTKRESLAMHFCRALGHERLAWSLRRLHVPVRADALVLEVGSGGNPYPRSNVLLDGGYAQDRQGVPMVVDRPTVVGVVERLPFKDRAFDFVIASHVFEHSSDPASFVAELQRVARAGYIETPDALMERLYPYQDHRLEVSVRDDVLVVRKKAAWINDPIISECFAAKASPGFRASLVPNHPFEFHVRYYWNAQIRLRIMNPETAIPDDPTSECLPLDGSPSCEARGLREMLRRACRLALSQRRRNASINLADLLACPICRRGLEKRADSYECPACPKRYPVRGAIPVLTP